MGRSDQSHWRTSGLIVMGDRLAGRVALITGGGAGIGAATARLFCREGARVMLVDSNSDALAATLDRLHHDFGPDCARGQTADVANADAAEEAAAAASSAWGGLDILINNAAMRRYKALADTTPQDWQDIAAVNLAGVANYCRAALPALRASGHGSIVNVSSCYAETGRKAMALYDATKAGQLAMTRTLAFEEAEHGVRVNAICPGSTFTDFHKARARAAGKAEDQLRQERQTTSLLGRWAEPDEIAWPILWLASAEASYITGTTLMVDGGLSAM